MSDTPGDPEASGYAEEERRAAEELAAAHYEELKRIARAQRRRSRADPTLRTTDILHESYIRLARSSGWSDERHFLRSAAIAMRHVLTDYARARLADKRGGGAVHVPVDEIESLIPEMAETPEQVVAIGDLMRTLRELDPRLELVVDCRFFAGFTEEETAEIIGVTARTVRRDWVRARAWLAAEIGG